MPTSKKKKWGLNKTMEHVVEPCVRETRDRHSEFRGRWGELVFGNQNPISLELGCGRGDYTLQLAQLHSERNFVGVDIKGHRFWHGATGVRDAGLKNAAFLRAKIEFIENHFAPGEVDQIWLTFSDPQPRDGRGTKRITSPIYLERYARLCHGRGPVHIKSDSPLLFERSLAGAASAGHEVVHATRDLYGEFLETAEPMLRAELGITTHYERRWIAAGRSIFYLQLRLAQGTDRRSAL